MRPVFYEPSGRVPVLAALALPCSFIFAAFGSLAYAWAGARGPWYLGMLTVWPLAFWYGCIVRCACRLAKVRNPVVMKEFGLVVGLLGWASQWIFWIVFVSYESVSRMPGGSLMTPLVDLFAGPMAFFDGIGVALVASEWNDDVDVGLLRAVGWICEIAILQTLPSLAGPSEARKPFCEVSGRWADVTRLPVTFATEHLRQGRAHFVAHPEQLLPALFPLKSPSRRFAWVTLYTGRKDSFISVEITERWFDGRRRQQRKDVFLKYLWIPSKGVDGFLKQVSQRVQSQANSGKRRTKQARRTG
jgi:hypothetical protein